MFIVNMYNKRNTNREHSVLPKKTKCYYNLSMLIKLSRGLLRSSEDDDTCVEIAISFYPHFGLRNDIDIMRRISFFEDDISQPHTHQRRPEHNVYP